MHRHVLSVRSSATLLALAVAFVCLLGVPAGASARATCDIGEFCLYSQPNLTGGLYEFSGSDSNLWTNDFWVTRARCNTMASALAARSPAA